MSLATTGIGFRDLILTFARIFMEDQAAGLVSLVLFCLFIIILMYMIFISFKKINILDNATTLVRQSGDSKGFQINLSKIEKKIKDGKSTDAIRLAHAISEYRETLLEPEKDGIANIRNSVRPNTFINLEELHFSLSSFRMWPGLFVSIGLFFTFLGLVAALIATQKSIAVGAGDQTKMAEALQALLGVASAKFTISLTGLFCSIFLTLSQRLLSSRLEHSVGRLANEIEKRIDFVSLEGIADKQLAAIKEQTSQQQLLNTQLIAELSKPLEKMTATGTEAIGVMVSDLGDSLASSIGQSLDNFAQRVDQASSSMADLSKSLAESSERFKQTIDASIFGFSNAVDRIEQTTAKLSSSAESIAESASPVMQTAMATAETAKALAEGSSELVGAAKVAVDAERRIIITSAQSIEQLLRAFESRAKSYDGQLENAFVVYVEQVQRTLDELRNHSDGIHDRYSEALQVLQAVIENARSYSPESDRPQRGNENQ